MLIKQSGYLYICGEPYASASIDRQQRVCSEAAAEERDLLPPHQTYQPLWGD